MARSRFNGIIGALIAGSMVISSTGAVAASNAVPAVASATQIDPWVALTAMSGGATAAALCGAATVAAAAQTPGGCVLPVLDSPPPVAMSAPPPQPIPVPPVEAPSSFAFDPLLLALGALAAGALVYFLVRNHHHSNSPA
jgi:pimeloyl-ACP methyl ester carboxylesterase